MNWPFMPAMKERMLRKAGKKLAISMLSWSHNDLNQSQPQGTGFAQSIGTLQMSMKEHFYRSMEPYSRGYVLFLNSVWLKEGWLEKNSKKENLNKLKISLALNVTINSTFISISFCIECGLINICIDFSLIKSNSNRTILNHGYGSRVSIIIKWFGLNIT